MVATDASDSGAEHLCARMTADAPAWWGTVGSALHTVSRRRSPNGPPPTAQLFFSWHRCSSLWDTGTLVGQGFPEIFHEPRCITVGIPTVEPCTHYYR